MTYEPTEPNWEIDENLDLRIVRKSAAVPEPTPQTDSLTWFTLAVLAIAGIAGITSMLYFGNLLVKDLQQQQETTARTELARIKTCINQ